jgi:23S rRNA C2498 (ribose-2'-O)-methylase RlmM
MADITRWYILFANYEQGLALHDLLDRNNIRNRIAPAPRAIQGDLTCGISLMIEEADIDDARACIEEHHAEHHAIVPLAGQIKPHRDKYC